MRLDDFSYDLPESLIAQEPLADRTASRLMVVDRFGDAPPSDATFHDLPDLLGPEDILVVNRSRVVPARLRLRRASGGAVEVLFVRALEDGHFAAWARPLRRLRPGETLFSETGEAVVRFVEAGGAERDAVMAVEPAAGGDVEALLERYGHVPLPPYIQRPDAPDDRDRYQTVYARERGSVAAPTAGLHFDDALLSRVAARGVDVVSLVLHVGPGTFRPLEYDRVDDNALDSETFAMDAGAIDAVAGARRQGRRIVAVGTTATRALETAASLGWFDEPSRPRRAESTLFIRPGYEFRVVGALVTNFHLPRSSLLMLVSAFMGRDRALDCYRRAVERGYRFYSYGDAMFIR